MIKVAINGFGRIGRIALRQMLTQEDFDVVAINSRTGVPEDFAYLTKYDSVFKGYHEDDITYDEHNLIICGTKKILVLNEQNPENLPWGKLGVDLVLECTGAFTDKEGASKHIKAGAKKVLISAPGKDEMPTIVYGVNDDTLKADDVIVSSASCTTNCLAPVLKIINDNLKITKGYMSTIHAYTSDQEILDNNHKKGIASRRGRSCAQNIVPASTGAAKAIGKVIPELNGKLDGIAFRVPVADGSLVDATLETEKEITKEELLKLFDNNKSEVISITYDPIVSSDIIGRKYGSLVDGLSTTVLKTDNGSIIKIIAWYDNEYGYTAQMLRTAIAMFRK